MEQREKVRGHLKKRILRNVLLVCTLAMSISTMVSIIYVQKIVRKQEIGDVQADLKRIDGRLASFVEDIKGFAKVVVADEDIQKSISAARQGSIFDGIKGREEISSKLRFYNNQHTYISASFIETESGERYSSSTSIGEDYIEERLKTEEIRRYMQEEQESIFSEPYDDIEPWNGKRCVCYRYPIWNQQRYGEKMGTLYLEIYLEHFQDMMDEENFECRNICLIGSGNRILYEKETGGMGKILGEDLSSLKEGVFKVESGYLVCETAEEAGWKICALIDHQYLWSRSGYVINFFLVSFLVTIIAVIITTSVMLEKVIRPITRLSHAMEQTRYNALVMQDIVHTRDEIEVLYQCYNDMVGKIQKGIEERIAYEKKTKEMEFDILLSQINPHYLYNVLHTIIYLAAAGKLKEVGKITNSLIFTLQETLKMGEQNIETTVKKELELTESYLDIQRYRYPDMFQVEIECEESDLDCVIPKTVIQPLVENAILHGVLPLEKEGLIHVEISHKEDSLVVVVEDNGQGIREDVLKAFENGQELRMNENDRRHIGISNIRDRIAHLYGFPFGMRIENIQAGGMRVTLEIPYVHSNNLNKI